MKRHTATWPIEGALRSSVQGPLKDEEVWDVEEDWEEEDWEEDAEDWEEEDEEEEDWEDDWGEDWED